MFKSTFVVCIVCLVFFEGGNSSLDNQNYVETLHQEYKSHRRYPRSGESSIDSCKMNCFTANGGSRCVSKSLCDCEAESGSSMSMSSMSMYTCDTDCDLLTECRPLVNTCTQTNTTITCGCKDKDMTCTYSICSESCTQRGRCHNYLRDNQQIPRCLCANGYSGIQCQDDKPSITDMDVTIGPYWGGTSIVFTGTTLGAIGEIILHQPLNITFRNESSGTIIIAETPPLNEAREQSELMVAVRLLVITGIELPTDLNFTYKPNPTIRDVYPRKTIDSGGLTVTVVGENLDSFTETKLVITVEKRNSPEPTKVLKSMCQKPSSTLIKCPTPEIKRSELFKNRNKRTISRENGETTLHRTKRKMGDDELLEFRLGLEFDGADDFSDMSKTHPHLAFLDVNADPVFEGEQMFTFDPTNSKVIGIKGAEIDSGAVVDDYKVYIGDAQCTEIGLTYDKLYCSPPETVDDIIDRGSTDRSSNEADVTVHIGYSLQYQVGYIQYVTEDPTVPLLTLFIPVVATIGGVLLILFIILIVCACRKSGAKDEPLTAPSVTDIDNMAPTGNGNYYTEQTPKDQYYMVVNKDDRRKGSLPPPDKKSVDGRI